LREAPEDNIFGKILRGEIPSTEVYTDHAVYAFLDLYPQNPGHTLVIPRSYSENVIQASEQDLVLCLRAVRKLVPAIISATKAKGVTVMTNMGREAGQMVEYLHFHVIPRYSDDNVSLHDLGEQQTPEALEEMASRIKAHL